MKARMVAAFRGSKEALELPKATKPALIGTSNLRVQQLERYYGIATGDSE
jgi:hypothetical protein